MTTDVAGLPGGVAWQDLGRFACVEATRRIRSGHAAEDFSRLSWLGLNLLKAGPAKGRSIRAGRLLAGWDHDYLFSLLTHEPNAGN